MLPSHTISRTYQRCHGLALLAITVFVSLAHNAAAQSQFPPPPPGAASPPGDGHLGSPDPEDTLGTSLAYPHNTATAIPNSDTSGSLSTRQIMDVLQQNPDLTVELKQQAADRFQSQGTQLSADDISDEMLFSQMASSASLRASLSIYLRARGYVSSEDTPSEISTPVNTDESPLGRNEPEIGGARSATRTNSTMDGVVQDPRSVSTLSLPQTASVSRRSTEEQRRNHEDISASTDAPKVLRQPSPYNLQSMRDLYTQIPDLSATLKRFGSEVFTNREVSSAFRGVPGQDTTLDVPVGPDYVLGPADALTINVWGGITQAFNRQIDRDGRLLLPEGGSFQLAGMTLQSAEALIASALKKQFRDARVAVTLSRLRSVRVYVVGDVQRPGGYEISSLATALSVLYAAGGPTAAGSLRVARHFRGKQLIEDIDLYDFILHGIRNGTARFESGDTLLVPPAGPQVAVSGAVKEACHL